MAELRVEAKPFTTDGGAWLLVLSSVFLCNLLKILLPSSSSIISKLLQKDAEQESEMRSDIQSMKQELSTISMMDEFARYARLERKINKMTDKLKTYVKTRTAQLAKIKWVINIVFYILQVVLELHVGWWFATKLLPLCYTHSVEKETSLNFNNLELLIIFSLFCYDRR
ncbi:guided entry of tail-anchored proteins factor 1 isoform X2 [Erythrolamprus reginae]|uniref:guided entry of tail-anchored proteins factor 1 isoform X2 n=1 Tax=Erythrolamprus reginae TaxID=121349 RepID=UPI00396CA618